MKALKISMVYIGLIIGAGFASGREVLEYFNLHSNTNMGGILIATLLFVIIAYMLLDRGASDNITDFSEYIKLATGKMSKAIQTFMLIYMFGGLVVMLAGSGALTYSISPCSNLFGAILMATICFLVMSFDLKGIVTLNLILVPFMIIGILYVAVCIALFSDVPTFAQFGHKNSEVALSAVCYAAYNTVTAGAVLFPLSKGISKKTALLASIIGGFCVGLLITIVWLIQGASFELINDSELPMLTLAAICGKYCKRIYTLVLFMAICTTAVSYGFGLMSYFSGKTKSAKDRMLYAGIICLAALPPAMYGFSNLVAKLYSIFGYIGMAWIIVVIVDRYRR